MKLKKGEDNRRHILIILSVAIIAVLLVPMLYSSIYLGSVWDVYGKIDSVPVAFVNLDKAVIKDGKEYAVGKEIEKELKDNKKVAWKFVNHEQAMEGVKGDDYYAVIEIPRDFSEKVANAQDGDFKNPEINYISNKGRNYIFSQISAKVADGIKTDVSSSIQKGISKALVDSLYDVKVSIKEAGDGAGELQSGTQKLLDGSRGLAAGTEKATNGVVQLENGLKLAANSAVKLQDGTQRLLGGSTALTNGLNASAEGSKKLIAGLKNISNGQNQILRGTSPLVDGLKTLKSELIKPNDRVSLLVKGVSNLNGNTNALSQGAGQLDTTIGALKDGINKTDSILHDELTAINSSNLSQEDKNNLTSAISALDKASRTNVKDNIESPLNLTVESMHQLAGSLKQLSSGTQQVSDGVGELAVGLVDTQKSAAAGLDQLIKGSVGIQNGSSSILNGLNTATGKTEDLANGLIKLNSGSFSLREGLNAVNNGNVSLKEGLNTAAQKSGELSFGLEKLRKGSISLKSGLMDTNKGAVKLQDGLNEGYNKMSSKLNFNSEDMSQFVSEPVILKDNSINVVKHYGEGLAPYFISLSLWLGAMFISVIFSIAKSQKAFKSKFMNNFVYKFVVGAGLVSMQALILSFVLIKGVGISPVSILGFYMTNIYLSIVFFSIMYGVSHAIGTLGAPIMFIVFLLQLASSGGTFPIVTAPAFYRVIGKVSPMTYSINMLRMVLSGINSSLLNNNISILLIFMIGTLCAGFIIRLALEQIKKKSQIIHNALSTSEIQI